MRVREYLIPWALFFTPEPVLLGGWGWQRTAFSSWEKSAGLTRRVKIVSASRDLSGRKVASGFWARQRDHRYVRNTVR